MSLIDLFRRAPGAGSRQEVVEGTIASGPKIQMNELTGSNMTKFRLEEYPDLEFQQEARPLAPDRRRGDHVRVHYRHDGTGSAMVEWIEKL